MPEVITDNLDLWTSASLTQSSARRGSKGKQEAYGIEKLRELILELAVRGKLVPQDPNDEPAGVLLEVIAGKKTRLVEEGEIKKEKSLPKIRDDEKPFALPNGWEWSRLQDVSLYVQRGKGPQYADSGKLQVVSQKCIQWAGLDLSQARYVDDASIDGYQPERFLRKDDLLWNSTGTGTVGRINVVPEVAASSLVADSHVTIIRPLVVNSNFVRSYISAPGIQQRIEPEHENALVSGTTNQVELNLSAVIQLVVPIPPLAEQHRIVVKVDELMAFCDQLEQRQTHGVEAHQTLVEALLGTLTHVSSQQELTEAWNRIANNFDTLLTTEQSIDRFKQTILQLAVVGKLVPQDPRDESASELLKRISGEREELSKAGKIKKPKELPEIGKVEMPFELPRGWEYVRLNDVGEWGAGATPLRNRHEYYGGDIPWFKSGELVDDYISESEEHVTELALKETSLRYNKPGDVLIAMYGATIGKTSILKVAATTNQAVCACTPFKGLENVFLLTLLKAFKSRFIGMGAGGAQPNISREKIIGTVIALPPTTEQRRIVAKVDELMALCDALKARLAEAQTTQIHLADAIVEQGVA